MTIKQFIEKAIEGGWREEEKPSIYKSETSWACVHFDKVGDEILMYHHQILLDPLAWEAVGKVEGWNKVYEDLYTEGYKRTEKDFAKEIRLQAGNKMHQMIDALIEGGSIESYLKTL